MGLRLSEFSPGSSEHSVLGIKALTSPASAGSRCESFCSRPKVIAARETGVGTTRPRRLTLNDGGQIHVALL